MKKGEKTPPPVSEEIDVFEEWEEGATEDAPKEEEKIEEPLAMPSEPVEKPKSTKATKPPKQDSQMIDEALHMSADVPVHLVAVIGRTTVSVKEIMNYQMGQVIDLGRPPSETVDLVASGKLFARGELVEIDGKLGVRIVKIIK